MYPHAPYAPRIHLALLAGILIFFAAIGAVYLRLERMQSELDGVFENEMAVLIEIPKLRGRLRAMSLLTEKYLLTGNEVLLKERAGILADIERDRTELEDIATHRDDPANLVRTRRELEQYLVHAREWGRLRRSRRMHPESAREIAADQNRTDAMLELLGDVAQVNLKRLRGRRLKMRRAAEHSLLIIALSGLCVLLLLLGLLSAFVTRPLAQLARSAESWSPGGNWPAPLRRASREIRIVEDRLRAMVERLNRELGAKKSLAEFRQQLVSTVAHEVNNALTVISGSAAVVRELGSGADAASRSRNEFLDILSLSVRSLSLEMTNLLELGKGESGCFETHPQLVDCRRLLRGAVEGLLLLARRKKLLVEESFGPGRLEVAADPSLLSLVATNLLSNAIKYTPAHGRIEIGARTEDGKVRVFVRDSGIGIKPADRKRIMSGYYRAEGGKSMATGYGIGLHLVISLLEAHGSTLDVESAPGKGSTFSFLMPPLR